MNPVSQSELHPDAEALNAFSERALPEAERAQVLAHLGRCARCREVVFLAQDAELIQETAQAAPARTRRAEKHLADGEVTWTLRSPFAWAAAAAFALAGVCGVFIVIRHNAPAVEQAKASRPAEPMQQTRATPAAMAPALAPPVAAATSPAPSTTVRVPAREKDMQPLTAGRRALVPRDVKSIQSESMPGEAKTAALANQIVVADGLQGVAGSMKEKHPAAPALAASPPPGVTTATSFRPAYSAQAPAAPIQTSPNQSIAEGQAATGAHSVAGGRGGGHATQSQTQSQAQSQVQSQAQDQAQAPQQAATTVSVQSLQQAENEPVMHAQAEAPPPPAPADASLAKKTTPVLLPSGLTAVSTAEAKPMRLALDRDGSLFVSADDGKTWQAVAKQWTGKAIRVLSLRGQNFAKLGSFGITAETDKPRARTDASVSVFQIDTDGKSEWISTDGKTWKAVQPPAQ